MLDIEVGPAKDVANFASMEIKRYAHKVVFDADNLEWTDEDFKRAGPPHEVLPADILKAFPKTRVPQAIAKNTVSSRP